MKITDECKLHLQTADLLLEGIKESMEELEKEAMPAPEHSVNSVSRRIVPEEKSSSTYIRLFENFGGRR